MGSLPLVRLPVKILEVAAPLPASHTKPLPKKYAVSQVTTAETISFPAPITNQGSLIRVFLPGMTHVCCVYMPIKLDRPYNLSTLNRRWPGNRNNAKNNPATLRFTEQLDSTKQHRDTVSPLSGHNLSSLPECILTNPR
jgi:hypothetical protein